MNNAQILRTGLVLLALPAFLAACSSSTGTAAQAEPVTETTTAATTAPSLPSPPPADGGSYEDVKALQEAYMLAEGQCKGGAPLYRNEMVYKTSIECDEDTILNVYPSPEGVDAFQQRMVNLHEQWDSEPSVYLHGVNWVIQEDSEEIDLIKERLGGELLEY